MGTFLTGREREYPPRLQQCLYRLGSVGTYIVGWRAVEIGPVYYYQKSNIADRGKDLEKGGRETSEKEPTRHDWG